MLRVSQIFRFVNFLFQTNFLGVGENILLEKFWRLLSEISKFTRKPREIEENATFVDRIAHSSLSLGFFQPAKLRMFLAEFCKLSLSFRIVGVDIHDLLFLIKQDDGFSFALCKFHKL